MATQQQKQPFESTLQDLVYSLDAGTGLKIIRTTLLCLFVIGLIVIFTARQFRGFDNADSMDAAQIGRNVAEQNRYVTKVVRPLTIAQVSANTFDGDARIGFHPELIRPPAYPILLGGVFKFFDLVGVELFPDSEAFQGTRIYPAEQWVIIPVNHLFAALTALMLYLLGKKLFSNHIALLGVFTYVLSSVVWEDSIHGTGIPMVTFFSIGAVYFALIAMIRRRERQSLLSWMTFFFLSIIFSAVAALTHYAALAVIPGVALFILMMGSRTQRGSHLAFFYVVLVLGLMSPWLLRNYQMSGSPLGLAPHMALQETARYPDDSLVRTLTPSFSLVSDMKAARGKWFANFNSFYMNEFTSLGGGLLICFFMVTFFYRFVRVHVHNLRWGIGLSMLLFFVGAGFFSDETFRMYHIFWPFVILYGLAFFSILLDRLDLGINLYKMGLTGLVIALTALPLLITIFFSPPVKQPYPPYYPPFIMRVSELLKPMEVICSDMPWATAWYGKRTSILLPKNIDDYYEINDYRKYISGLYITTITKDRPFVSSLVTGPEKTWLPISMGRLTEDFPLRHGFPLNEQDQIFLTDSPRWSTASDAVEADEGGQDAAN